jgi:hypothetical protein
MNVFTSPVVKLEYDDVKKVLYQNWNGFASTIQFREGIEQSLTFVKNSDVQYIISNTSLQRPVGPEDSKYAATVMPQLFANGVKGMAFIMPKNVITKLALSSFAKDQGMPPNVKYFDDVAEAEKWLLAY